jgi:Mn2+/Fe2+ NRAMP family transporter
MLGAARSRWGGIVFWSVISAAFIGPGTVTTAALSGNRHGTVLLWALLFSTAACYVLQEASARVTILSGRDLAAWIGRGESVRSLVGGGLVAVAVILGCAAYEAGNLLGAAAGVGLVFGWSAPVVGVGCALAAALLLWWGHPKVITTALTILVALMGLTFVGVALRLHWEPAAVVRGLLVPSIPAGAELLVLGLVGTTVVPYNLFLGSGLARGRELVETRFGLAVAIGLGGLISMAVILAGAAVAGPFSFARLAEVLEAELGLAGRVMLAVGLFAAGLSSAITAPWAAAMTARCLAGGRDGQELERRWGIGSWRFRSVWGAVVGCGIAFVAVQAEPVPVIVAAQALNGLVLPLAAAWLFLASNDHDALGSQGVNTAAANVAVLVVVAVAGLLGALQVTRAGARMVGTSVETIGTTTVVGGCAVAALIGTGALAAATVRRRRSR